MSTGPDPDPDRLRAEMLERWEHGAAGWGRRADKLRTTGMPVTLWLIEHLDLQPGQRVLELAAGPGDLGFLAAEQIAPAGTLISSDGAEAMVELAQRRARELGVRNVEFKRLQLEWIDLPTASVDAALCRWAVMLSVDPAAAMLEIRRVLRPGGRVALAVWDEPKHNPWATIPTRALLELGLIAPPDPRAPGMFALAAPGLLEEMLLAAGFVDVAVEALAIDRPYASFQDFLEETLDLSSTVRSGWEASTEAGRRELAAHMEAGAAPFTALDGSVRLPGRSLVAVGWA